MRSSMNGHVRAMMDSEVPTLKSHIDRFSPRQRREDEDNAIAGQQAGGSAAYYAISVLAI
jgi:hypothetical protein